MTQRRRTMRDVIDRLEALHMIALEIDAFQSVFDDLFNQVDWSSGESRRRDLGRLGCYLERVNESVAALLDESRAVLRIAMGIIHARPDRGE